MIFDNSRVTELVLEYQATSDPLVLDDIIAGCRSLVEVIVSEHDQVFRDDLIQESFLRIIRAIDYYNPDVSNLHNYLTTVIRNICITYMTRQSRQPDIPLELELIGEVDKTNIDRDDVLPELIARNRDRFPSIPVELLDNVTHHIYRNLIDGELTRGLITQLSVEYDCPRSIATVIYQSTMVYLRLKHINYAAIPERYNVELSLMPDLELILGKAAVTRILLTFSGMALKIP